MFDHVGIRVADRDASRRFYDTVLATLGRSGRYVELYDEWDDFAIGPVTAEHPLTRRLHVAFVARSRAEVDAFWQAGVDAGYASDGEPGPRPEYHANYYGGFLLDPDGNSAEAVYHGRPRRGEFVIDHLWLRVADPAASRRFYETVAPVLGLSVVSRPDYVEVHAADRSFSLVPGEPTQNVHIAIPVADDETVRQFHRVATAAGHRDNGAPGERPIYHPGYYGAFVLDPDGNNIEAVNHNQ
jgi:catechol 2,3-dioxygenase-like lactoylglutathione lyase family enzyme